MSASTIWTDDEVVEDRTIFSSQSEYQRPTMLERRPSKQPDPTPTTAFGDGGRVPEGLSYQIGRRLTQLMLAAIEDGEALPSRPSIRGLRLVLSAEVGIRKMPLVGMNDDGLLSATWKLDDEQMLSLRFIDERNVGFAWAIRPSGGKKIERCWGDTTWMEFLTGSRQLFNRFTAT